MKFSKQFEGQLVPEWKDAYVDYWQLKKDVKNFHVIEGSSTKQDDHNYMKTFASHVANSWFGAARRDHGAIHVHKKLASSASSGELYETEIIDQFEDNDAVKEFFKCLDEQLTKVNKFYMGKEKEYMERGECLLKQIDILLELKSALKEHRAKEEESVRERSEQESVHGSGELDRSAFEMSKSGRMKIEDFKAKTLTEHAFSCQGKPMTMSIPLTTPSRTLSAISNLVWDDIVNQSSRKGSADVSKLSVNKTKLRRAEKTIRGALLELYKGLNYLKTYQSLNMLAFMKILKKFDKVTGKQVQPIYLKVVESSYFNTSDKAFHMSDKLENIFLKNFEDDKRKAMKYLKPKHRKDSHPVTFFIGLFTGCFIALVAGYAITARVAGMYRPQPDTVYMETAYPVLSFFCLMFLHFFVYGCNIYAWKKARINYSFIFELIPRKELKYRDVFLITTSVMTAVMGVMFLHLTLLTKFQSSPRIQAIPGLLLLAFILLLVCPFEIFYKSSRYRFLRVLRNIVLSPLYKVVMLDFFMADQLCSQIPLLRNLEFIACYYITGSYKTLDYGYCVKTKNYRDLAYAVSFLPYYWRAMQCARRWFDEGDRSHLVNLGKYTSAMLAAGAKVAYEKQRSPRWMCLLVVVSSGATVYQLYWDFVKDWGLLQVNSKNPWLRNELMLRKKFIYYISMVLNLVLRLAWLQTVLHSSFGKVDYRVTGLFFASLEVVRRGQWNFYRLENEHLNNAGKFRAVKTVPLPFREVDEED